MAPDETERGDMRENDGGQAGSSSGQEGQRARSVRGFAAMSKDDQRAIARKGGAAVSTNREHMREIGRRGAEVRNRNRGGGSGGGEGR